MVLVSTVAEAAIAPAMISACTSKALRARVDQAGAELRQVENARHQGDEARQVERDDAAREAGERKREEELPGPAQPAERPPPAAFARHYPRQRDPDRGAPKHPRGSAFELGCVRSSNGRATGCDAPLCNSTLSTPERADVSVGTSAHETQVRLP